MATQYIAVYQTASEKWKLREIGTYTSLVEARERVISRMMKEMRNTAHWNVTGGISTISGIVLETIKLEDKQGEPVGFKTRLRNGRTYFVDAEGRLIRRR